MFTLHVLILFFLFIIFCYLLFTVFYLFFFISDGCYIGIEKAVKCFDTYLEEKAITH